MALNSGIWSFLRRRLNIRHIALMAQLDDARSGVRAAEAAGMSQPPASTLLKGFEEALDVSLFERHGQAWILPPPGSVLRERLAPVFLHHGLQMLANVVRTQSLPAIVGLLRSTNAVPLPA